MRLFDPGDMEQPIILPELAEAQKHQSIGTVGQAERPDLALGPPLLQVAVAKPEAGLLPAGAPDQIHVDPDPGPFVGLTPGPEDRMHRLPGLSLGERGDDASHRVASGARKIRVAQGVEAADAQHQCLDLDPREALRRQGRILGERVAVAGRAVDQDPAGPQRGDVAVELATGNLGLGREALRRHRRGQAPQHRHQAHQSIGAGHRCCLVLSAAGS